MYKKSLAWVIALGTAAPHVSAAGFIEDSKAYLSLRNNYFTTDNRESRGKVGNTAYSGQNREWGQAFQINYVSGFTQGTVGVGLDALGSLGVRLDGGGRAGKTGVTRTPGQLFPLESDSSAVEDYSRLGLTGKLRYAKSELRVGTLQTKLPVLLSNDGRLLPQTYQGYQLTSKDIDNLTLVGGLIEHAVGRASTNETGLAVNGGTRQSNKFTYAGGDWAVNKGLMLQYYYGKLEDYYTQHFVGLTHTLPISGEQSLKTDLRYFRTAADGANATSSGREEGYTSTGYASTTGKIDNRVWSAAFTYSLGAHSLMLGHQRLSGGSGFFQVAQNSLPNEGAGPGSYYLLTDRQISSFIRADEHTTFGQYTYDFAALGAPGLKVGMIYLKGDHIATASGGAQKEWERDISLDYVIQSGPLKNLGFAIRHGSLRSEAANDLDQTRLIMNYSVALF
ncbi:OprD family porin [Pseudomonas typographi]|uniref:OprD family porin n=1 Tax=Pseudomonas typographi TaxID=2715964 RepID=UPI0016851FA7|nr:OprD family porin [Pseudomonas typographi]MBD1587524.1 OprD family porin [Pseudomonas typographi]